MRLMAKPASVSHVVSLTNIFVTFVYFRLFYCCCDDILGALSDV